jgi:hypothetical protein
VIFLDLLFAARLLSPFDLLSVGSSESIIVAVIKTVLFSLFTGLTLFSVCRRLHRPVVAIVIKIDSLPCRFATILYSGYR